MTKFSLPLDAARERVTKKESKAALNRRFVRDCFANIKQLKEIDKLSWPRIAEISRDLTGEQDLNHREMTNAYNDFQKRLAANTVSKEELKLMGLLASDQDDQADIQEEEVVVDFEPVQEPTAPEPQVAPTPEEKPTSPSPKLSTPHPTKKEVDLKKVRPHDPVISGRSAPAFAKPPKASKAKQADVKASKVEKAPAHPAKPPKATGDEDEFMSKKRKANMKIDSDNDSDVEVPAADSVKNSKPKDPRTKKVDNDQSSSDALKKNKKSFVGLMGQ